MIFKLIRQYSKYKNAVLKLKAIEGRIVFKFDHWLKLETWSNWNILHESIWKIDEKFF